MLNYIWAGLLAVALVFALTADFSDLSGDRYRNGQPLPAVLTLPEGLPAEGAPVAASIAIEPNTYQRVYRTEAETTAPSYSGTLSHTNKGYELLFSADAALPKTLQTVRDMTGGDDKRLRAIVQGIDEPPGGAGGAPITRSVMLRFAPVRFVKLSAITSAAIDTAETAVTLALGLIGVLALWLGLMRIGEKAGLIQLVVRLTQPLLRPLFPEIPPGHPALGMIALNLSANMLGLGNAATPMGLKAMEELQTLNPRKDTATNAMVMLLALNTAGVQLVPPAVLIAILGIGATELLVPIWLVTLSCAILAAISAKLLARLPAYRRSDPQAGTQSASAEAV
jgi:spore maturation protein A